MSDTTQNGPMLAADGTPLKRSLNRALRRQKLRALMLIAPLLIFVLVTFIAPIADMLFRSVENQIVSDTLPTATEVLEDWDHTTGAPPGEEVYQALYYDLYLAAEARAHTRLGTRLNYEYTGVSSLFRSTGRGLEDLGEEYQDILEDADDRWGEGAFWYELMTGTGDTDARLVREHRARLQALENARLTGDVGFAPSVEIKELLPQTTFAYTDFAVFTALMDEDVVAEEDPWEGVYAGLAQDLETADLSGYDGPGAEALVAAQQTLAEQAEPINYTAFFESEDKDWVSPDIWATIQTYSSTYTGGYFLNAVDMQLTPDGIEMRPDGQRLYMVLFQRTLFMSLTITLSCILLGYPVAWLLANLPASKANLLMILVLLPFWTSLLVRTSAWKVMLQQQGVINDVLVWLGLVDDAARLVMINNQFGTIVAMTHILLPFMILPLYSVMQGIPPSYLRAAKSLGATNWTAFWRVYFPQSVPGIGAGSILVFILAIGYYITPEIVGGRTGTFISNRIAYHISTSLNWGLAAALGAILLAVVLLLYWAYDRIVGIDNVKLG
ncbi:Spermidine/putrescine transport system permease protein PotB [Pseudooceanicola marinus]|uniref:Spermidine/putrescine transport system permease protein PotB n=1 Tax=Pseudooceanicola marinus TaxID=396013 RepID=A0A1X6ZMP4_9RHOB|nr:ABC transporter permease [Pseudooceanicola marinus]PJE26620.1 ABC transporter permease [Pseudooceanicola marinus]SLN55688.1 Spermidine/putrescine transport system permease protein PotB [Pseudooceanicola marinus]